MPPRNKGETIALWMLSGLLSALFLMSGASKLAGMEMHVQNFARWRWPDWMRLSVGAVEVTSAIMLVIPGRAFSSAPETSCW